MTTEREITATKLKRPRRKKAIYLQVVEQIQHSIREGKLIPGDQLLPERELADQFGVSRPSIRQALAVLDNVGIIEITPRDGAYVRRQRLEDAIEPLTNVLYQEREQVAHLFEMRQIIETQAVCRAARRRTEADLVRLRELNHRFKEDLHNPDLAFHANTRFHIGIVETAKNPLLTEVMTTLLTATLEVYATARETSMSHIENRLRFVIEHEAIIAAVEQQDEERASDLVAQHVDDSRQRIEIVIKETT